MAKPLAPLSVYPGVTSYHSLEGKSWSVTLSPLGCFACVGSQCLPSTCWVVRRVVERQCPVSAFFPPVTCCPIRRSCHSEFSVTCLWPETKCGAWNMQHRSQSKMVQISCNIWVRVCAKLFSSLSALSHVIQISWWYKISVSHFQMKNM